MIKRRKNRFLITAAVILTLIGGVLSIRIVEQIRHAVKEQTRTHNIITNAEELLSSLKDAETGQRGFLLTKNETFLEPYKKALTDIDRLHQQLVSNTRSKSLKAVLVEIKPLIDERLILLNQTIQLQLQGNNNTAIEIVSSASGKAYMDKIRQHMEFFKAQELELLKARGMIFEATVKKLTVTIAFTFGLAIIFVIVLFTRINRLKEDAEERLNFRNALVNNADIGIVGTNEGMTITSMNAQVEKIFGLKAAEVLNSFSLQRIIDKLQNIHLQYDTNTEFANAESLIRWIQGPDDRYKFEAQLLLGNNHDTTLSFSITKSKDTNGNFLGYLMLVNDITELRITEIALRDNEQRYRLASEHLKKVIDSSIDMICTIDANGHFIEVGAVCMEILGYKPEELIGKPFLDFVHPEDVSKTKKAGLEITQGKPTRDFQNRYIKKGGTIVHMMWSAIWSESDQLMYAVARDMTATIKISEELKAYEELINLAGDIANVGGWSLDLDTEKFFWTRQVYKLLDFPEGETPSLTQRLKLYKPESRTAFMEAIKDCKAHGTSFDLKLETNTHKDRTIHTRLIGKPVKDMEGKVVRITGAVQDMTAEIIQERNLIAAKEAAISANAAKDVFLSTMSHEIRTPLNGLLGMLELLSYTKLEDEQRENLKVALDSGRNLIRIINDLLDHAKIEAGKLQFLNEPNSIHELIASLELSYIQLASTKNIALTKHIDPSILPFHMFDSLRLTQILGNLISNAIKFTESGVIKIEACLITYKDDKQHIALSVADTGLGISEEVKTRLFKPFEQASSDTARMYGGTGLGLSICRKLAEMMGGHIELESELGKGSKFTLYVDFPVAAEPASHMIKINPISTDDFEHCGKVLVVDDHPVNRKLLSRQLAKLNMSAEMAENGEVAFEKFQLGGYVLIITDCNMPVMDGYELARKIREYEAEHDLERVPMIAWTANALSDAREAVFKAGMDDILIKPSEIGFIKSKLSTWLPFQKVKPISSKSMAINPEYDKLFDLTGVTEDAKEQVEILEEYCQQTRKDLEAAKKAIHLKTTENLQRLAHQIKGASRLIHARAIVSLSEGIETCMQGKQRWTHAKNLLHQIENQIRQLEDFIIFKRSIKIDRIGEY